MRRHEPSTKRKTQRRLGPDWTLLGLGAASAFVAAERLAHAAGEAWAAGSWHVAYREWIPLKRQDDAFLLTTPHEALTGSSLFLSVLLLIVGVLLLRSAFNGRRSPW